MLSMASSHRNLQTSLNHTPSCGISQTEEFIWMNCEAWKNWKKNTEQTVANTDTETFRKVARLHLKIERLSPR